MEIFPASGRRLSRRDFSGWRKACLSLAAALLIGFGGSVHAAPSEVHALVLSHHEFAAWTFTPKPGEQIDILNHSSISHSIYITYPDGTVVNLGVQLPGATVSWKVPDDAEGDYLFQCWIHPIIRATLPVSPE